MSTEIEWTIGEEGTVTSMEVECVIVEEGDGKTTIRTWLDNPGFDWESGRIVYQRTEGTDPAWDENIIEVKEIRNDDPVLDFRFFSCDPACPRFVAQDKDYIYFPMQSAEYGAVWPYKVARNIEYYLDVAHLTPYPGG